MEKTDMDKTDMDNKCASEQVQFSPATEVKE